MSDIADLYEKLPKPAVHQLPWPRLNSLLFGFPGISIDAASKGGIADGEVMALCGGLRSFRTTVCCWLAGHFIERQKKKVTFFTFNETFVREAVAGARLGFPASGPARPTKLTYWSENGHELDVLDLAPVGGSLGMEARLRNVHPETGVIIIDVSCEGLEQTRDLARAASYIARLRRVPVFCTFQLGRHARRHEAAIVAMYDPINATMDHTVLLDPTETRRHLVLELVQSREGKTGVLLLDGSTLEEVL